MTFNTTPNQFAIQQNNVAVSLIEEGNYNDAIITLSEAFKIFKQFIQFMETSNQQIPAHESSMDQFMSAGNCSRDPEENEDNQYIYRRAIRIPPHIDADYSTSVMVSSMIVFNLALAHQLSVTGVETQERRNCKKLHKAAKLYELSFGLQQNEQWRFNLLYTLATVNNLGLVYHQLHNNDSAGKCLEHLLSALMVVVDCGKGNIHELEGFFRNTSSLISKHVTAAAA
jgi:tetratricopeptide (TPR) repeat protein